MARSPARSPGLLFVIGGHWRLHSLFILTLAVLLLSREQVSGQLELQVAYITTDDGAYVSNGSIPAVMLAVEQVNNVSDYKLVLNRDGLPRSTSCERRSSLETYFDILKAEGPSLIALIGCGCSLATEPVAEIANFNDIVHISYASSSPSLSNRHIYPGFWRTYPSEDNFSPAVLAVVKQYGWRQLKILTQEESIFVQTSLTLTRDLREEGIRVDESGTTSFSSLETFTDLRRDTLFSEEIRVFVLNMYEKQARSVLCEAAKLGTSDSSRYVPGYVWIIHGWYKQNWWTAEVTEDDVITCSDTDLEPLVRRSIAILQIPTALNETATTALPLTARMFNDMYQERLQENEDLQNEPAAALAYDAVWTLALALNRVNVTNILANNRSVVPELQRVLSSNFSFQGVSGLVEFDANGTRVPHDTRIFKYRDSMDTTVCQNPAPMELETVPVAVVLQGQNNLTYLCESCSSEMTQCETDDSVWPGGVPRDGISTRVITTIKIPLFVIYAAMATAGHVFVIVCLVFNIVFRERKIVKLTSPKLNYVVLLGAFMLYTSVYFYVLPSTEKITSTVYCHVRAWLQPGGYLICFGTIVLKMWRVYYIFHNPSAKKKRRVPKDWMLFVGVLVMFGVFAVIQIGVTILDDYKAAEVEDRETSTERDEDKILVEHYNLVCEGKRDIVWIAIIIFYIIATQLVAVYLAFRTRKVKIKALNDAKYLTLIIYISTLIITVMMICVVSLRSFLNADAAVFSAGILIFTTLVLGLLFVPKMVILYKDPRGERIFNRSMSQGQATLTAVSLSDAERDKLHDLEKHCRDLENRLGRYEHVQPFRSLSRSCLFSGSTDLTHINHTMSTSLPGPLSSITKPPINGNAVNTQTDATQSSATSSDHTGLGLSELPKSHQQGEGEVLQKPELVQQSAEQSTQC